MMGRVLRVMVLAVVLAIAVLSGTEVQAATKGSCYISMEVGGQFYDGYVTRSYHTSCPFARNVTRASLKFIIRHGGAGNGDFYVFAWSPVTGRWYHVHCFAGGDLYASYGNRVDCRAGLGARVIYRAYAR
jgi:hypothetical protein